MALLALLGAAAAAAIASARRADAAAAELARRGQIRAAAAAILAGEVSLAGRLPPDVAPADQPPFAGLPPLEILLASGAGDSLLVRYHDVRFREGPTDVEASFEAGRDGRGRWNLYRRAAAGVRQPALEEVEALEVVALYLPGGRSPATAGRYPEVTGLELAITFAWGERDVLVIAFDGRLEAQVR